MKVETIRLIFYAAFVLAAITYAVILLKERRQKEKENKNLFNPPEFFDE